MKNIFKNLTLLFALGTIITSCDNKEDINYNPKDYNTTQPAISIVVENYDEAAGSFDFTLNSQADGYAFYAITPKGVSTDAVSLINERTSSSLLDGKVSLNSGTDATVSFEDVGVYKELEIHVLMTSEDGFGSNVVTESVTLADTTAPTLIETSPGHETGGHEFENQSITFKFDDLVKLADNATFTFDIFQNGVGFVDNFSITNPDFQLGGVVVGDYASEITISGWNGQPLGFTIVSFAPGTFVDAQGLEEANGKSGFEYYFRARSRTADEVADLLVADWDYNIVNNAFNPALLSSTTGTWTVTKGSEPATIILSNQLDHDINAFIGGNDSATQEFIVTVGAPGIDANLSSNGGYLTIEPLKSGIDIADLFGDGTDAYWTGFYQNIYSPLTQNLAGFYDLDAQTMELRVDFGSILGSAAFNYYFGDIQYNYTYVPGTGLLGRPKEVIKSDKVLKVKNESLNTITGSIDYSKQKKSGNFNHNLKK